MALPVTDIELVRRRALTQPHAAKVRAVHKLVVALEIIHHRVAVLAGLVLPCRPNELTERALLRRHTIFDVVRVVVGDVERQLTAAVHVGHRHRNATTTGRVEPEVSMLRELPRAVVQEDGVRTRRGEQDQVEISVGVQIGECSTRRVAPACPNAGGHRDLLESPSSEVAEERAAAFRAREKEIHAPVAVHVTKCDTSALTKNSIGDQRRLADSVFESDARGRRTHLGEPGSAAAHIEVAPAVASLRVPGRSWPRPTGSGHEGHQAEGCPRAGHQRAALHDSDRRHRALDDAVPPARATTFLPMQVPNSRPLRLPAG